MGFVILLFTFFHTKICKKDINLVKIVGNSQPQLRRFD